MSIARRAIALPPCHSRVVYIGSMTKLVFFSALACALLGCGSDRDDSNGQAGNGGSSGAGALGGSASGGQSGGGASGGGGAADGGVGGTSGGGGGTSGGGGLEGFGAVTPGGAGRQVVHVTTLDATGPGSLYDAMGSNRTIVFDVGGTIEGFRWDSSDSAGSEVSFLTIDGSTAPAPGITLENGDNGNALSFQDGCHDVIVQHIRVRSAGNDGINVISGYNMVFNHVSVSGTGDGGLDLTDAAHDITVQWSILGPGKSTWSGAMLIAYPGTKNISIHHNLFASQGSGVGERNPLVHNATDYQPNVIDYLMADFTNNVVWSWGNEDGGFGYGSAVDYGGTLQARNNFYESATHEDNAILTNPSSTGAKLFATGNVSGNTGVDPNGMIDVAQAWDVAPVTTDPACDAAANVVAQAGAQPLDATDQAIVNSVLLGNCK
jgi:hypothetical protein